jgi:hypothetical protein
MKKVLISFIGIIIFMFMFSTIAFAETKVYVDLEKLDMNSRNAVINAQKAADDASKIISKENAAVFSQYGKAIADTFAEICKTLNVEVNSFANTPVGQLTMWLIVYKVIGQDILHVVYIFGLWFLMTLCCFWYGYTFHIRKKIVQVDPATKNTISTNYIEKFVWDSNEAKCASGCACIGIWIVISIVSIVRI